jgi:hypothetical protein
VSACESLQLNHLVGVPPALGARPPDTVAAADLDPEFDRSINEFESVRVIGTPGRSAGESITIYLWFHSPVGYDG